MTPYVADQSSQLNFALFVTQAGANALLAVVLIGLQRVYRRAFLAHWGAAWLALTCSLLGAALAPWLVTRAETDGLRLLVVALTLAAGYAHVAGLLSGAWLLVTARAPGRALVPFLVSASLLLGFALAFGSAELAASTRALARNGLLALVTGLAFVGAAVMVSALARREPSFSRWLVVGLLFLAGSGRLVQFAEQVAFPQGFAFESLAGVIVTHSLGLFLQLLLLAGLLLWFFEDERGNLARAARALAESEEQRRRSEHMEAVGRLAGGVAHDFNNLLTAITGHAEILLARAGPAHPDREDLQPIARAAARAAELVRELLTFSRRQPLRPRNFVLDELLGDVRRTLERVLGENARFELQLGAPGAVLHADPSQIELAVLNLVSNARDAIRGRGVLRLTTSVTRLEAGAATTLPTGSYLLLEVADDGCGIAPEAKAKIFEPFFTTKPGKGTGLGLSSVYGIVTRSGGEIRVESAPGRGTTFRIWLPLVAATPERRFDLVPAAPGVGGHESILLVEDEDQVRELARRLLTRAGYRVSGCASGDQARACLQADPTGFQLVLSDVVMPGLPLEELLATVRDEHRGLRVLLMSGYSGSSVGRQGVDLAVANYLQKPFTSRELLDAVRAALDGPLAESRPGVADSLGGSAGSA